MHPTPPSPTIEHAREGRTQRAASQRSLCAAAGREDGREERVRDGLQHRARSRCRLSAGATDGRAGMRSAAAEGVDRRAEEARARLPPLLCCLALAHPALDPSRCCRAATARRAEQRAAEQRRPARSAHASLPLCVPARLLSFRCPFTLPCTSDRRMQRCMSRRWSSTTRRLIRSAPQPRLSRDTCAWPLICCWSREEDDRRSARLRMTRLKPKLLLLPLPPLLPPRLLLANRADSTSRFRPRNCSSS